MTPDGWMVLVGLCADAARIWVSRGVQCPVVPNVSGALWERGLPAETVFPPAVEFGPVAWSHSPLPCEILREPEFRGGLRFPKRFAKFGNQKTACGKRTTAFRNLTTAFWNLTTALRNLTTALGILKLAFENQTTALLNLRLGANAPVSGEPCALSEAPYSVTQARDFQPRGARGTSAATLSTHSGGPGVNSGTRTTNSGTRTINLFTVDVNLRGLALNLAARMVHAGAWNGGSGEGRARFGSGSNENSYGRE